MKQWFLPGGFVLIILFMLTVITVVVLRMNTINNEVDEIVNQHNAKVGHITTMYTAARERSISLLKMTTMEDPFDREEEFDIFNALATKFTIARTALLDMPTNDSEQELLEEHGKLVGLAVPQQLHVIDLLAEDDFDKAERILIKHAIPAQNNVLHKLTELSSYQKQAAKEALANTRSLYSDTVRIIIVLAVLAVMLCMAFAWHVIRTLRAREAELRMYSEKLEERVHERTTELEGAYQDLKNSQSQLVQSEKMASLGQLTAGIAHEIKNPLNFINNFSETAIESVEDLKTSLAHDKNTPSDLEIDYLKELAEDLKSDLEKISNHGKRADGIVRSMLTHAREGGGQRERININSLVEENLNLAYHSGRAKSRGFNINIETVLNGDAGEVTVEPQEISRVLLNLFSNAFYATEKRRKSLGQDDYKPKLIVETRRTNGNVWIKVTDNGVGMPAAVKAKIFDPFYTTKPTGEGTGLGLSLSYDIVTQSYGGKFEVESEEGRGTSFRFCLPSSGSAPS